MLPVAAATKTAPDRTVEAKTGRELGGEHPRGEHDHDGAGEEQAKLDRREMHSLDQYTRCRREYRKQSAHDQADGRGRNEETAIGDQAQIVPCDRERIKRGPRRIVGLAKHSAIGDSADRREQADKDEFRTPAEDVIERAAEQRRESGRRRHRDHDQRHRARQRRTAEEIAGDGARQHRG